MARGVGRGAEACTGVGSGAGPSSGVPHDLQLGLGICINLHLGHLVPINGQTSLVPHPIAAPWRQYNSVISDICKSQSSASVYPLHDLPVGEPAGVSSAGRGRGRALVQASAISGHDRIIAD